MVKLHTLYSVTFRSEDENLLEKTLDFSLAAEVEYFDSATGTVRLRFGSTASKEVIAKICDDFKKEYELGNGKRLTYEIETTA